MFSRKSYILRIGKYHVLLLQLSIYYKNSGESGWFNDLLMQELLMTLKEPIQKRLSVKLSKDKKTKQDEVEIGTGTTMKFGFQFVNKEMNQPFVIPDNTDDKFRSLCLFEEKLKVTVCPLTTSSVEDKATTILLNSSSQLSREKVAISDYFNKCQAFEGLATESAQKKRCKLKRM
ncbi:uncharacterized protein LOC117103550 [Anneissia japonica]|uniref:uncharacterized protein LOC117103550 n=1 Tax=Anneissia japonica TaxID=1529436 RepID=UPI001425727C|nr:uncharacterized protein LOC117103550 [Anneissia japonica]